MFLWTFIRNNFRVRNLYFHIYFLGSSQAESSFQILKYNLQTYLKFNNMKLNLIVLISYF